jgi:hypothetical protein
MTVLGRSVEEPTGPVPASPGPSRTSQALTIVVAFAVFAAAGVLAWRAFGSDSPSAPAC